MIICRLVRKYAKAKKENVFVKFIHRALYGCKFLQVTCLQQQFSGAQSTYETCQLQQSCGLDRRVRIAETSRSPKFYFLWGFEMIGQFEEGCFEPFE